jgi:glycosyltransferase involved in cell wall biosynthesis
MRPIRVAHVITRLELGGAQSNTLYTVSRLNRERFEPHLIAGSGGMLDEDARKIGAASITFCDSLIREIRPLQDIRAYRELRALFRSLKPDVVHTHSSKAGILARFAADSAGVPVIIHTYHGFGFHRYQNPAIRGAYVAVERAACRHAHHLIFVSQDNWKWADELGLTRGIQASLIRSGIPFAAVTKATRVESFRNSLGVPQDATLIGMIACLKPQKDPVTYIRAASQVLKIRPGTFFLLVGDGELKETVLKEAGTLPAGHFHFLGWRRDIHEILHDLNLLVLTSLWEGLPRVIPEAIAARVPVVASNIDGNREIVQLTGSGLLAQARDPADFAAKIVHALETGLSVSDQAMSRVRGEFDIDDMIRAQEKLYQSLTTQL